MNWTAATDNVGVARYNVHRSTTAGFTPAAPNRVGQPTGTSYTDSGLAAGTYYYRVTAEDAAGNVSASSAELTATVLRSSRHRRQVGLVAAYGLECELGLERGRCVGSGECGGGVGCGVECGRAGSGRR